ncbi:MAG: hypothetical protein IPQ01_17960 [Zoogloea sp.]|nr:hypothetical protein [Zoogloea sp.]
MLGSAHRNLLGGAGELGGRVGNAVGAGDDAADGAGKVGTHCFEGAEQLADFVVTGALTGVPAQVAGRDAGGDRIGLGDTRSDAANDGEAQQHHDDAGGHKDRHGCPDGALFGGGAFGG